MSNEHLNTNELALLSNGELTGQLLVKALLHIEECEICRTKIATAPDAKQVLTAIFAEKHNAEESSSNAAETTQRQTPQFWIPVFFGETRSLNFGLAAFGAAVLAVFIGTVWWFSAPSANLTANRQTATANLPSANFNEQNETAKVSPEIKDKNVLAEPPAIASETDTASANNSNVTSTKIQPRRRSVATNEKFGDLVAIAAKSNRESVRKLDQSAAIAAHSLTSAQQKELNQFLINLPVALASLRPSAISLRGGASKNGLGNGETKDNVVLLAPQGETIRETRPHFKWQKVENAERYKISVFNRDYEEVTSAATESNSYQLPKPLRRGDTYFWQVTAQTSNGELISPRSPASPAIFRVASEKTVTRLQRLQTQNSMWKTTAALLKEGMLGEAEVELDKILKQSPQNELAQNLLRRVQTLRQTSLIENSPTTVKPIKP